MKKQLDGIIPIGAPWGGPESVSFMSCFTSMLYTIEDFDGSQPLYCCQGPGLCLRCGRCVGFDWQQKYHEQLYHLYLTLSGLAFLTIWTAPTADQATRATIHRPWRLLDDEYLRRSMDWAGYEYTDLSTGYWKTLEDAITDERPVLVYDHAQDDWHLVAGYDSDSQQALDDRGNALALHDGVRVIAVTGPKEQCTDYIEAFRYLANVLRDPIRPAPGYVTGLAAYDAVADWLGNDAFFAQADEAALSNAYESVHAFIGMLAENRCFAAMVLLENLGIKTNPDARNVVELVGAYHMQTHNQCWGAWAVLGQNHICEPDKYSQRLRERAVRDELARYIRTFQKHDRMAALLLEESANTPFLQPQVSL